MATKEAAKPQQTRMIFLGDSMTLGWGVEKKDTFESILEQKLDEDAGMAASFAVNTRENARLTFDHKVRDHVQDMIDTNFKFFKQFFEK